MNIILWIKANWQYFLFPAFVLVVVLCIIFCPGNAGADTRAHYHLESPLNTAALRVWAMSQQWELVPEITKLRGHFPQEGEIYDCQGYPKDYGDCAVSPDIPIDPYAEVKTEVLIWKPGVGWIEGRHLVNDVTAPWKRNMIDLYVPNEALALALTCDDVVVRRKI